MSIAPNRCIIDGCGVLQAHNKSLGYCSKHLGRHKRHGDATFTKYSGKSIKDEYLYRAWSKMKTRCYNPTSQNYRYYGARGIKVCSRWLDSLDNFIADMGERPTPKHSIDRIDNDGDYTPENCRWATSQVQSINGGLQSNNKTGYRGVYTATKSPHLFKANITVDKKSIHLGTFNNIEDAVEARRVAEQKYFTPILNSLTPV